VKMASCDTTLHTADKSRVLETAKEEPEIARRFPRELQELTGSNVRVI